LHLTLGSAKVELSVVGFDIRGGRSAPQSFTYEKPITQVYESTCLRFSLNKGAIEFPFDLLKKQKLTSGGGGSVDRGEGVFGCSCESS